MKVKVNITEDTMKRLTFKQIEKIREAERKLNIMVNSDQYREWCLSYERRVKVVTKRFLWWPIKWRYETRYQFTNTHLSRELVYVHIMTGKERLEHTANQQADINLEIDWNGSRRVLGHTYPNSTKQWIHKWFLEEGDTDEVKGNIWHEWLHKAGFTHEKKYSVSRQQSVPYTHGYFARDF